MSVFKIWRVLCALSYVGASLSVNPVEYEGNYSDDCDNEISQDQQEGTFCLLVLLLLLVPACLNRWLLV